MYPRSIIEPDLKSQGEGRVFELLRDGLDDSWRSTTRSGGILRDHALGGRTERSTSFVSRTGPWSAWRSKGGGLECRHGEWFRLDRKGGKERMRDPFAQALDHRYALERMLERAERGLGRSTFLVHALASPDITVHELVLAADAPHEIVLDRIELRDVQRAIDQMLAYHEGSRDKRGAPGKAGSDALRGLLAPQVTINVPLASDFLAEQETLIELTRAQSALISQFGRDRRMVITGCAGSGKTVLAVEQAKRRVSSGRDVGYVCFNRGLRDHLRSGRARRALSSTRSTGYARTWPIRRGSLSRHTPPATPRRSTGASSFRTPWSRRAENSAPLSTTSSSTRPRTSPTTTSPR